MSIYRPVQYVFEGVVRYPVNIEADFGPLNGTCCYFEGEFLDYEPFFHFYIRTYFCTCVVWIEDTECGRKSCTFGYERLFFPGAIGESRCCSSGHLCFDKSIMSQ